MGRGYPLFTGLNSFIEHCKIHGFLQYFRSNLSLDAYIQKGYAGIGVEQIISEIVCERI